MRGHVAWGWCAIIILGVSGCGGGQQSSTTTENATPTDSTPVASPPPPADTTAVPATSPYDSGPRAGASAVNAAMAATGEGLFKTKGCVTCHAIGKKVIGPDLHGVTMRRTAEWMEHQILHPEVMLKEDPITRSLLKEYKVPMTNQKCTPEEAKSLIEFLKREDRKSGATS